MNPVNPWENNKVESLEEYYKRKFAWLPANIRNEIGHFNVFRLDTFIGKNPKPVPYKRRDYFKIMLVIGNSKVHYADRVVEVRKQALTFSNPQIPYAWENLCNIQGGVFCIFNQHFFEQYGNLSQYQVFQPGANHIFELTEQQVDQVGQFYKRMFEEINSDYLYKYDVLRIIVFELIHFAMKMEANTYPPGFKPSDCS